MSKQWKAEEDRKIEEEKEKKNKQKQSKGKSKSKSYQPDDFMVADHSSESQVFQVSLIKFSYPRHNSSPHTSFVSKYFLIKISLASQLHNSLLQIAHKRYRTATSTPSKSKQTKMTKPMNSSTRMTQSKTKSISSASEMTRAVRRRAKKRRRKNAKNQGKTGRRRKRKTD